MALQKGSSRFHVFQEVENENESKSNDRRESL